MRFSPVSLYRPFWFGAWGAALLCSLGGVFAQPGLWLETALFLGLQALATMLCWRWLGRFPEHATAAQMIVGVSLCIVFTTFSLGTWRNLGIEDVIYGIVAAPYALGLIVAWGWAGLGLSAALGTMLGLLPFADWRLLLVRVLVFVLFVLFAWLMYHALRRFKTRFQELERSVNTDALTQIGNRKALLEDFVTFQAAAQKKGLPLLLSSWDVDGLKRINDRQGHQAGDEYIKSFVAALRGAVRDGDGLYRTGGDEFVGLHLGLASGNSLYGRVRGHFPQVSGGWSRATTQTLDQALTEADVQMYAEKRAHKAVITSIIGESQTR
jgi:membrane protein implicated in regulation of membrane protease activity